MKDSAKAGLAKTTVAGAVLGAGTYCITGGVGVAAAGTAIGITLFPFIALGAVLGSAVYGCYWFGKQKGKKKE